MPTQATVKKTAAQDYVVKDIGLAEWGRKEIAIAEIEMPAIAISLRPHSASPMSLTT